MQSSTCAHRAQAREGHALSEEEPAFLRNRIVLNRGDERAIAAALGDSAADAHGAKLHQAPLSLSASRAAPSATPSTIATSERSSRPSDPLRPRRGGAAASAAAAACLWTDAAERTERQAAPLHGRALERGAPGSGEAAPAACGAHPGEDCEAQGDAGRPAAGPRGGWAVESTSAEPRRDMTKICPTYPGYSLIDAINLITYYTLTRNGDPALYLRIRFNIIYRLKLQL